jgi:hypothetical protein
MARNLDEEGHHKRLVIANRAKKCLDVFHRLQIWENVRQCRRKRFPKDYWLRAFFPLLHHHATPITIS